MTIEEKLLKDHGVTRIPELAVWMLKDGTLVNGSYCGHQRDVDHHEIGQYFKRSKFHDPGSAALYMRKFMRRGNIRMGCSSVGYVLEYAVTPSTEQMEMITKIAESAEENAIEFGIAHYRKHKDTKYMSFYAFLSHLRRYTKAELPEQVSFC